MEEREKELEKRDVLHKEHVAKLEAKVSSDVFTHTFPGKSFGVFFLNLRSVFLVKDDFLYNFDIQGYLQV